MPKPIVAIAWVAAAAAGLTGCPSLSALECQGAACSDAGGGEADGGGAGGIKCGGGVTCGAPQEECCVSAQGSPTCVPALQCSGGSDIFCDDPSQCSGGPCWLCNAGGFQGTSCNYQADIVQAYKCTNPNEVYRLCRATSECDAGSTCSPLTIPLPWVSAGTSWFSACQP